MDRFVASLPDDLRVGGHAAAGCAARIAEVTITLTSSVPSGVFKAWTFRACTAREVVMEMFSGGSVMTRVGESV